MHWKDIEEIAETLELHYPDEELDEIKLSYLEEMVRSLDEFEDYEVPTSKEILKEIQDAWLELKNNK